MGFTAEDERRMRREHFEKYDDLADRIGIEWLKVMVTRHIAKPEIIKQCLATDRNLNNIALARWDRLHNNVEVIAHENGIKAWSLSDSVCVLKHVARHYIGDETSPDPGPLYCLKRDGQTIMDAATDVDITNYLHQQHCYSLSHACEHEGYTVEPMEREK